MRHAHIVAFTGHMVDAPDRTPARFPASKVDWVRHAIAERLRAFNVKEGFSSAARGSDILFIEEMLSLNAHVHVFLPFPRADFARTSVGLGWNERFYRVLGDLRVETTDLLSQAPHADQQADAFRRCNAEIQNATIAAARRAGATPMLLAVWNGVTDQERGGTFDAIEVWRRQGLQEELIDVSKL